MNKNIVIMFSGKGSNLHALCQKTAFRFNINICATISSDKSAGGIDISNRFDIPCHVVDFQTTTNFESSQTR